MTTPAWLTHFGFREPPFAKEISDTVCFLEAGRILEQGSPAQMFSDPQQPATRDFLARVIASGRL